MKIKEIYKNIFLIEISKNTELCRTFIRFQEHYESPEFKGKNFSLNEFKKWYTANSVNGKKTGKFTYYTDWSGFNVPGRVLKPFYDGKFGKLSKPEQTILDFFEKHRKQKQKFYIIGVQPSRKDILTHELAHALWFTNSKYRLKAKNILNRISIYEYSKLKNKLLKMGYHEDVIQDEIHAYTLELRFNKSKKEFQQISLLLKNTFDKYIVMK